MLKIGCQTHVQAVGRVVEKKTKRRARTRESKGNVHSTVPNPLNRMIVLLVKPVQNPDSCAYREQTYIGFADSCSCCCSQLVILTRASRACWYACALDCRMPTRVPPGCLFLSWEPGLLVFFSGILGASR